VSIVTDSDNNVYILVPVGKNNLNVDGVPKTNYGNSSTVDYMIASFSCTGTYCWSKVIGGGNDDYMWNIVIHTDNNNYGVGRSIPGTSSSNTVRFDNDIVLPTSSSSTNTFKKSIL